MKKINRAALALLALLAPALTGAFAAEPGSYARRAEVRQFVAEMVARHGFVARELHALFRKVHYQPAIIRAMTPPADAPVRSWQDYRALLVDRDRIEAGVRFREQHAAALARAQREFGVPSEIIVAIIGIETVYGRNMGAHRVIDTLSTLAFDFPRRGAYFRSELENFLLYARDSGIDVLAVQGSYAGAIGIPQFMPGSYRRFALDYDGDGRRNLQASPVDAIGSVANFLHAHGWEAGQPVAVPARVSGGAFRELVDAGIRPAYRIADLPAYGIEATFDALETPPPDARLALVELLTPGQPAEYWVGLQNFFTLTRYNRSSFYAIAVLELARAITQGGR